MKYMFVAEYNLQRETLIALSICVFDTLLLFLWPRFQDAVIQYSMGTADDLLRSIFSTILPILYHSPISTSKKTKQMLKGVVLHFLPSCPLKPYRATIFCNTVYLVL